MFSTDLHQSLSVSIGLVSNSPYRSPLFHCSLPVYTGLHLPSLLCYCYVIIRYHVIVVVIRPVAMPSVLGRLTIREGSYNILSYACKKKEQKQRCWTRAWHCNVHRADRRTSDRCRQLLASLLYTVRRGDAATRGIVTTYRARSTCSEAEAVPFSFFILFYFFP